MATIRTYLQESAVGNPEGVALRWKTKGVWHSMTNSERLQWARTVAAAASLMKLKEGDRVALMMENRPEWMTTYLGLACSGFTVVPVDAKLHEREVSHILRDSGASAVFSGNRGWPVLREIEADLPELRNVVLCDGVFSGSEKINGTWHHDYAFLMEEAAKDPGKSAKYFDTHIPTEADVASILYTSGTTGRPKGAMLTHGNFAAQIEGCLQSFKVYKEDNFLLVLPLHHAFAFTASFLVPMASQSEVSMVESLRSIPENMREVSPSVLLAVPLLAEKMLAGIMKNLKKSAAAGMLLKLGLGRMVGKKVVGNLGGKLRILICGGAASDVEMLRMYNKFGIHTIEGYGLTETAPICALTPESEIRLGTVGKAFPNCELKIDQPGPEGVGEICVRGPITMKGYFHNQAATDEVFENGWFHTGDLGKLDETGYLTITGRKKSLIVNREGKNIYPEEVEIVLDSAPHVLESVVVGYHAGDEKGERVGAIIVPDMDKIAADFPGKKGQMTDEEISELCRKEVREAVSVIAEYKRPRKFQVRFEPFERTTTQKIKRYLYAISEE